MRTLIRSLPPDLKIGYRFGGTLLGPARFTHIADCTRAVCTAMYERERAAERASRVADLVAQLREWDTEVAELRLEIAALEPNKSKVETDTGRLVYLIFTWQFDSSFYF